MEADFYKTIPLQKLKFWPKDLQMAQVVYSELNRENVVQMPIPGLLRASSPPFNIDIN